MGKLKKAFKYWFRKRKTKKGMLGDKPSFTIDAIYMKSASAKGADVWGKDWVVPVAEKLEWQFYETTTQEDPTDDRHPQYLVTKLTDYIFFFIPFSYDEYIYEVPNGTYRMDTISHKDVVEAIALCEKWNWHGDKLDNVTDQYNAFGAVHLNDRYIYKLGNGDYSFIRTR